MEEQLLPHLITWIPALLLLLLGVWLLWPAIQRRLRERRLCRILHSLGPEVREDIVLEDGLDGLTFINYAVSTPDGVTVVEVMPNQGAIFGSDNSDQWVQVVGHKTTRFANPLTRINEQVSALRFNRPDLRVRGLVLFSDVCSFPKGRPNGVVLPADLATDTPPDAVPATLKRTWDELMELATTNAARYRHELLLMKERPGRARTVAGFIVVIAAFAWSGTLLGLLATV